MKKTKAEILMIEKDLAKTVKNTDDQLITDRKSVV